MARRRLSETHRMDTIPMLDTDSNFPNEEEKTYRKVHQNNLSKTYVFKAIVAIGLFILGIYLFSRKPEIKVAQPSGQTDETIAFNTCNKPAPGRPLNQYVLMIDAGSSGSRIHVYRFNYCSETPEIENEVFEQLQPGLSSYINSPIDAAKSLDPLMEVAMKSVPEELRNCTPVTVKATAGLRKFKQKGLVVLDEITKRLKEKYPFPIIEEKGVEIMSGKDEGIYAWITVNYLLGKLNVDSMPGSSVATIDLGGGSVQLVFEPQFKLPKQMEEGHHKYVLEFAERQHILYQHSYLGYGLNEARSNTHKLLIKDHGITENMSKEYNSPCIKAGSKVNYKTDDGTSYIAHGNATNFNSCHKIVKRLFRKDVPCSLSPCAFDGIYQPSLKDTFGENDIYAFSFFYDRTQPFGLPSTFKVSDLKDLAEKICSNEHDAFHGDSKAEEQLQKPYRCFDVTYLYSLLRDGFDIEESRIIRTAKKLRNLETGWCLGASIAVLDDKRYCKA